MTRVQEKKIKKNKRGQMKDSMRLCTIHCFGASHTMLSELKIEKERKKTGLYAVKCMVCAFNAITSEAYIYAEFERVGEKLVKKALEKFGATQIQINSYSISDYMTGAASGLQFVRAQAEKDGFTLIQRGASAFHVKMSSSQLNLATTVEFDVVKKRRLMSESTAAEDDDPEALRWFEEFEASVLDALTGISQDYQKQRYQEFLETENDLCNGIPPQKGMFYVAVSRAVQRGGGVYIPKLGATRRNNPMTRLKELSRTVPYAFELVYAIATFTPFKLEAEIHLHFDARRIKERGGASTEFFNVDLGEIGEYLKAKYPGEVIDGGFAEVLAGELG